MIDKKIWRKDFHILANHLIGLIFKFFSFVYPNDKFYFQHKISGKYDIKNDSIFHKIKKN
jgi:hypothetical protein